MDKDNIGYSTFNFKDTVGLFAPSTANMSDLANCAICGKTKRKSVLIENTCAQCREKALEKAIDLGVHVNDYIDALITTKKLEEENKGPEIDLDIKIELIKKRNKGYVTLNSKNYLPYSFFDKNEK